ncbi:MAG TPA: antibiotic biosynthesis monooxygenase [Flavitalea sp.]|nr:antibiotic biosynthesis monooxygenase [Flavitalea sp.]
MNKILLICLVILSSTFVSAQDSTVVRIARIQICQGKAEKYKAILKEEIAAAVRLEPGVIALYSVADKVNPNLITVFEIYASDAAYRSHILTPHFLKYKTSTKEMIKSLDLSEHEPIFLGMKK